MADKNTQSVVTCKGRISYPHLFEPQTTDNGRTQYDCVFIIPKPETVADPVERAEIEKTLKELRAAAGKCAQDKWGAQIPPALVNPIKDGDGTRPTDGQPYGPEVHGSFFINAASGEKWKPSVVLNEKDPLTDGWKRAEPSDVYAGCFARIAVSPYAWNYKSKNGVSFNLVTVQKLADGDPLGFTAQPEKYFGSPAEAAGVGAAGQTDASALFG